MRNEVERLPARRLKVLQERQRLSPFIPKKGETDE